MTRLFRDGRHKIGGSRIHSVSRIAIPPAFGILVLSVHKLFPMCMVGDLRLGKGKYSMLSTHETSNYDSLVL
jgi:hypothetical protein